MLHWPINVIFLMKAFNILDARYDALLVSMRCLHDDDDDDKVKAEGCGIIIPLSLSLSLTDPTTQLQYTTALSPPPFRPITSNLSQVVFSIDDNRR